MAIVAGVDFGTLNVRVSIVDSQRGRLGSAVANYPLKRKKDDPDHATQKHQDHMDALLSAMRSALQESGVNGEQVCGAGSGHDRLHGHPREHDTGTSGRLLPVV